MLNIEVCYGTADKQKIYRLQMVEGSTARQAVQAVNLQAQPATAPLGIFGKAVKDDYILRENDRIEIYRPLVADPKEARRKRVSNKK